MSSDVINRREASARATREALLASARVVFGRHGYANASLADIVRDASATTGAVYHHFVDKKGLFAAVAESIEVELLSHLAQSAPKTDDSWELVVHAVVETLAYTARPGLANVIFKEAPTVLGAAAWREVEMRHGFGQLHARLGELARRGQLASFDPAIVAGVILGALMQVVEAVVASDQPRATLKAGRAAMLGLLSAFRTHPASDDG